MILEVTTLVYWILIMYTTCLFYKGYILRSILYIILLYFSLLYIECDTYLLCYKIITYL